MLKVSVIIPTLNEEARIAGLLAQLTQVADKLAGWDGQGGQAGRANQAGQMGQAAKAELELIVSDGGSLDGTLELCAGYPVKLVNSPSGRGMQLNSGAALAGGEFLLFLHADSCVSLEMFEELVEAASRGVKWGCFSIAFTEAFPEAFPVGSHEVFTEGSHESTFRKSLLYPLLAWCSTLRARLWSSCYGDQGVFCRKSLFYQVGGFPALPLMEDVVLSRKLRKLGRATVLSARLVTSARHFTKGGLFRTVLKNQVLKLLFILGVSPTRLAAMYNRGEGC